MILIVKVRGGFTVSSVPTVINSMRDVGSSEKAHLFGRREIAQPLKSTGETNSEVSKLLLTTKQPVDEANEILTEVDAKNEVSLWLRFLF